MAPVADDAGSSSSGSSTRSAAAAGTTGAHTHTDAGRPGFRNAFGAFLRYFGCGAESVEVGRASSLMPPGERGSALYRSSRNPDGQVFDTRGFIPERANSQITRRYKISPQEIGAGGYGRVFRAEDREIVGRWVAIKQASTTAGVLTRSRRLLFEREVSMMKQLDHPNICKLLETYAEGKSLFLVMEYCDGGELFEHIAASCGHGLSEAICVDIVRQVAGALNYAHGRGIAHRDLKPENVCLCGDTKGLHTKRSWSGQVKVIDWGLSQHFGTEGECRMRTNVGSIAYAAPEVLENRACGYSSACDLWSLGVLTYVTISGRFPFSGSNSREQLEAVRSCRFSVEGSHWARISREAKLFIASLLKKDPKARPTATRALQLPWLRRSAERVRCDSRKAKSVLATVQKVGGTRSPVALLAALAARQLGHERLRELSQVFLDLDLDGDGVLDLSEVKIGFEAIFGRNSPECREVEKTFELLDLDKSGSLDYTEFCAAGLGEKLCSDLPSLKAAFKAFDVHDDNNRITRKELQQVLTNANVSKDCIAVEKVFSEFDFDGDGTLDFEEWRAWMMHELVFRGTAVGRVSPTH